MSIPLQAEKGIVFESQLALGRPLGEFGIASAVNKRQMELSPNSEEGLSVAATPASQKSVGDAPSPVGRWIARCEKNDEGVVDTQRRRRYAPN